MTRTPTDPFDVYTEYGRTQGNTRVVGTAESAFRGADASIHSRIAQKIGDLRPRLHELVVDLYEHPEIAFAEHRSVEQIAAC